MAASPLVAITRPRHDSAGLAAALRALGYAPLVTPLLAIRFQPGLTFDLAAFDATLLTSANGARALARGTPVRHRPVFAVGAATAAAAAAAGFSRVTVGGGDVASLAATVRTRLPQGRLLHPAGQAVAGDLAALLPAHDISRIVAYRALAATRLPRRLAAALQAGALAAILFYSPRTAAGFARLAGPLGPPPLTAVCLSPACAAALAGLPWLRRQAADTPTGQALLARLVQTVPAG